MKRLILILVGIISAAGLASAADLFSYTATASPGTTPDGVDQNNNPVDVWTIFSTGGGTNGTGDSGADGSGVYFGTPGGVSTEFSGWQEYSYQNDGVGLGG